MSTLLTETFPGAPGGMNLALPANELDDTEARYIQDGLVDFPGMVRRRGPVQPISGIAQPTRPVTGLVSTLDPLGQDRYAVLNGNGSNGYVSVYSDDLSALVDLAWPFPMPTAPPAAPYSLVDVTPGMQGGAFIGVSNDYDALSGVQQGLAYWRGGNKANYSTGTLSVSRGSASVAGSGTTWLANAAPGMFLFANTDDGYTSTYVGVVKEIVSDTVLVLTAASPYAITAKSYTLQSLRGIAPKVTKGRITCDTTSPSVNGGNTRFLTQGLDDGTWNLYRARDMAWIGTVSTATSDTSITLSANAAVSCADDDYVALQADGDWSINTLSSTQKVGWITAAFAERQWYANVGADHDKTYRLWFSDTTDPEALDLSEDGDWLSISSSDFVQEPIRGLMPAYNALLIFKENETFALTGSTPSSFSVQKIEDDGVYHGMSVQPYGGGVLWAGRQGVHFYDGVQVENLLEQKLGDVWKNSVSAHDPNSYRMYSMVVRDHYWLFIENLAPTVTPIKGQVSEEPTKWTVVINMVTRAVTMQTNVDIRGSVVLPASAGRNAWYVVNDNTKGYVCDAEDLYDQQGVDSITSDGGPVGPDFFFESKKFDGGDPLRLKKFKLLLLHYLAQGGDLKVDIVLGLNDFGVTLSSTFPASVFSWTTLRSNINTWNGVKDTFSSWAQVIQGVFVPKRIRFHKQSQLMAFRVYQSSPSMSRVRLGPFQIAYKALRPGRA